MNPLVLGLLNEFDQHVSSGIFFSSRVGGHELNWRNPAGFTGLHYATYFGMVETVVGLLDMKEWDLEETDVGGNTAILWAARNGRGAIVKVLLKQGGVAPDTADKSGRTPLSWAAGNGYEDVARILLEREDVTPNTVDRDGQTPILWATRMGSYGIVEIILQRKDVTPDTADSDGRTPLLWAAENGYWGIVKRFLEREDVTPDTADKHGRTPLWWAEMNGRTRVVGMLRERCGVSQDMATTDPAGQAALAGSSVRQHEGVVRRRLGNRGSALALVGSNVAMKGGVRSKNDRRRGTRFFKPGGYKIEPLLKNR